MNLENNIRSEIGYNVWLLWNNNWKHELGGGRGSIKRQLARLLQESHDCEVKLDPHQACPAPIPYEIEFPFI